MIAVYGPTFEGKPIGAVFLVRWREGDHEVQAHLEVTHIRQTRLWGARAYIYDVVER